MGFGTPHRHYRLTDSTNSRGRELAAAGAPHGTIVTAGEQSAGRGRQGRIWTAPPGGALLYSAIVRPLREHHVLLPLAAPLAVCEAAEQLQPGIRCKVKWPNDVHLEGRKLAGILIEARPQDGWAVIGVGLNLVISQEEFPPDLRETATSLDPDQLAVPFGHIASERNHKSVDVLNGRLEAWLEADEESVLAAWRERDALLGREVAWDSGSGVADGVDDRGYLVVVTPGGERVAIGAGEVHLTSF